MGLHFKDVNHIYNGITKKDNFLALDHINLDINSKNEFITIVGKTGSGKSSLVMHMNALLLPSSGDVYIFDKLIKPKRTKNKNLNDIRKKVGLVFQFPEYQLFEETVLKDVMFGPRNFKISKEEALLKAKAALELVKIDESFYDKSPLSLSGGQMRKVAIAGILAMEPDILVLDEPTRGLDTVSEREILEIFYDIFKKTNKTIIMITHDMDIVYNYSTRIIVMDKGKIVFNDNKDKLFKNNEYKNYSLEEPEILKLTKYLNNNLNLEINNVYNYEQLLNKLKEVNNG